MLPVVRLPRSHVDPDRQFGVELENGIRLESAELLRQKRLRHRHSNLNLPDLVKRDIGNHERKQALNLTDKAYAYCSSLVVDRFP